MTRTSSWRSLRSLACLLAMAAFQQAQAVPITLDLVQAGPGTLGPPGASSPCVIAGTRCQNPAGFGYTNYAQGGNIASFDESSPVYRIDALPFRTFDVGVEVNSARRGEILEFFRVLVDLDGAGGGDFRTVYEYSGGERIGSATNHGAGSADWVLGTVDLRSLGDSALVRFDARWTGASGGPESFYLSAADVTAVAEPATFVLFAAGMLVAFLVSRPRRRPAPLSTQ